MGTATGREERAWRRESASRCQRSHCPVPPLALSADSFYPLGMTALSPGADQVLRAMTVDGAFRVLTAVTTRTVSEAVAVQDAHGATAQWLGELITGAAMVREAMAPDRRVQVLIKDADGRTRLVADAHPKGWNRGIVNPGARDDADMSGNAILEVIYTLPNDVLQHGVVQLPAGGDVSMGTDGLYAGVGASHLHAGGSHHRGSPDPDSCGRWLHASQLLPDAPRAALEQMTRQLAEFDRLTAVLSDADLSADALRAAVLGDIGSPGHGAYVSDLWLQLRPRSYHRGRGVAAGVRHRRAPGQRRSPGSQMRQLRPSISHSTRRTARATTRAARRPGGRPGRSELSTAPLATWSGACEALYRGKRKAID